jgi:glycosyltransferase involved in cell wall biosynthesis
MSSDPLVSIITPTRNRAGLLPLAHRCVGTQSWPAVEWLVLDDSPEPSAYMSALDDPRIRYLHDPEPRTTGAKRNLLIEQARGAVVAHFDDDDYYAPQYLKVMMAALEAEQAAIAKLFSFFLYATSHQQLGYWDLLLQGGFHFVWMSEKLGFAPALPPAALHNAHLGYGFSYVYRREAWEDARFEDVNCNEDNRFIRQVTGRAKVAGVHDREGLALHVHHGGNSSRSFPQYQLPPFLLGAPLCRGARFPLQPWSTSASYQARHKRALC